MKNLFMLSMIILTVTSCKTNSSDPSPRNPLESKLFDGKYQTTIEPITPFEILDGKFSINDINSSYISGNVDRAVFSAIDDTSTQYVLLKLNNNQLFSSEDFKTQQEAEESINPKYKIVAKKI